ncbi:hypothetical protein EGW08_010237, partial [Elysia chlorotica]
MSTTPKDEDGTPYIPPVSQSVVNDALSGVRDDQMSSTPHTVSYSPSNSEGRLSIGTDEANVPHSVQFSPTDDSSSVQFSPPAPAAGESRVVSNTRGEYYIVTTHTIISNCHSRCAWF